MQRVDKIEADTRGITPHKADGDKKQAKRNWGKNKLENSGSLQRL